MKIKSTNQNEINSIINPQDKPATAESPAAKLKTSTGVGSVISQFEIQSPTALDKMLEGKSLQPDPSDRDIRMAPSPESKYYGWSTRFGGTAGKVRENLAGQEANQKLSADQFSVNEKGQVVVTQNQAETLKAQTENSEKSPEAMAYGGIGRPVADKTQPESHIWMNAATKRASSKSPEVEAFVIDGAEKFGLNNPEARSIVQPEDTPLSNSGPVIGTNTKALKIKK